MKKKLFILVAVCFSVYLFAAGSQETADSSGSNSHAVKIENFNHTSEYSKIPERIISLSLEQAETLSALGLADKIVLANYGHNYIEEVLPEHREALKSLPVIDKPTLEAVIAKNPDFMFMPSYYFFSPPFGKYDDYKSNNINIYVTEGSFVKNANIKNTYNDIRNLAKIFKIEKRAEKFIRSMKERENTVIKKLKGVKPVKCFVFDSETKGKIFTAGGTGLENSILEAAGGKNIFADTKKQFMPVSIEQVIAANPEVIIINAYPVSEGGQHYKNDGQRKIELLKAKKELAEVPAIKNNKFIIIPLVSVFPGVQNINALENIAKGLHPDRF